MTRAALEKTEDAKPLDATSSISRTCSCNMDRPEARFTNFCEVCFCFFLFLDYLYPFSVHYHFILLFTFVISFNMHFDLDFCFIF